MKDKLPKPLATIVAAQSHILSCYVLVETMKLENKIREMKGESMAYGPSSFEVVIKQLTEIASKLADAALAGDYD